MIARIPRAGLRILMALLFGSILAAAMLSVGFAQPPANPSGEAGTETSKGKEAPLPKLNEMPLPTPDELLRGRPLDWLVLLNGDVIQVEPVSPRPDTLAIRRQQRDEMQKRRLGEITLEEKLEKVAELERLDVSLIDGGEDPEYRIEIRFLDKIVYFEDLILQRVTLLLDKRNMAPAYELLLLVARREPNWPTFEEHYQRYLFLESERLEQAGQAETALVLADRLYRMKNDYPQIGVLLGRIIDRLMTAAIDAEDHRQARHFLARLVACDPQHPAVERWRNRIITSAQETLAAARQAQSQGDPRTATLLINRTAEIWPALPKLIEVHREISESYQLVHVGIIKPSPTRSYYPFPQLEETRRRLLCSLRLFEEDRLQNGVVRFRSPFIESWEPRNLGRDVVFRLHEQRMNWESRPVLTGGVIVEALREKLSPHHPEFDERWANDVKSLESPTPWELRLTLNHIPLRMESRLRLTIPMNPAIAGWSGDLARESLATPDQQRFYQASTGSGETTFRRARAQSTTAKPQYVAELIERPFETWEPLLQALLRGEIDMTPRAEWRDVAGLKEDGRFFVQQYALPTTHILLIHPESALARNTVLRRALMAAVPAQQILKRGVLGLSESERDQTLSVEYGRQSTGPFASTTYGYVKQLPVAEYDPLLAASLASTARGQFGGNLPTLRLCVPDDPCVARAVPALLDAWKRVGISVEIATDPVAEWDLSYRLLRLSEPVEDLWPLLTPNGRTDVAPLAVYPDWLRTQLVELEQASDWTAAVRLLHRIQTEFFLEARWIPLWEVEEYLVLRKRFSGLPLRPMHAYHGIERWALQSWFPTETP